MKNLKLSLFAALLLVSAGAMAQNSRLKVKLNYNIGMPVGAFKSDYISNTSFNGGFGEIGYRINPKFAVGLNVGMQSYYQKYGRQGYKTGDNQRMSAVLSNTVDQMPVLINGTFSPLGNTESKIQPYVNVGAGLNLVNFSQYYGEFSTGNTSTSFAAQAGAGVMVPFSRRLNAASLQLGATFNYAPYNKNGLKNPNNVGVNAGMVFPIK